MSSPASLTLRYLSPRKALWKFQRACLTSRALARCVLSGAALMSASLQVPWQIQDAHTFVVHGVLVIPPLIYPKAASPLVQGFTVFGRIGQQVRPRCQQQLRSTPFPCSIAYINLWSMP